MPDMPILPDEDANFDEDGEDEDALPQVITADMLRAGMAQRKEIDFDSADFEIPAELLVGLDDEEKKDEDIEDLIDDDKKKKKPAKKKGKRKRSSSYQDEDDYRNYY